MSVGVTQPPVAPLQDPLEAALGDSQVRRGLLEHAHSILGRWLAGRPAIVRSEACAEAIQETLLRALQKRRDFDVAVSTAPAWLHGILNKVLCETARSFQRSPAQAPADPSIWERMAADLAPQAAERVPDRLAAADYLKRLPAKHQQVMQLWFYEDLSHQEIAARLGISPGAARVRLSRALTVMKAIAGAGAGEDRQ